MKIVRGVWFGAGNNGSDYLHLIQGMALGKLTLKRCLPAYALIPWTARLDWLEAEVHSWGLPMRRCWPEERIAMRDLVVERMAEAGLLVHGTTGDIDPAEIELAEAKLSLGIAHTSKRVRCLKAEDWLRVGDTDEWGDEIRTPAELQKLYQSSRKITEDDTRELRARLAGGS